MDLNAPGRPRAARALVGLMFASLLTPLGVGLPVHEAQAQRAASGRPKRLRMAVLVVVTNFEKATVRVNERPYPAFRGPDEPEGMLLPAGGPYTVTVEVEGKARQYTLSLNPNETRYLVIELSNFKGSTLPSPASPPKVSEAPAEVSEEEDGEGKVTVYAKPRGTIIVDGQDTGKMAPNTVPTDAGRHEIQVRYEDGEVSEKKIVRVRKGSSIKLFFRQQTK